MSRLENLKTLKQWLETDGATSTPEQMQEWIKTIGLMVDKLEAEKNYYTNNKEYREKKKAQVAEYYRQKKLENKK